MIKHIVAFDFPESGKLENIQRLKRLLEKLPELIPEIKYYEVGVNIIESERSKDMVLISEFENIEALRRYAAHPEHQQVVQAIQATGAKSVVVDFEF